MRRTRFVGLGFLILLQSGCVFVGSEGMRTAEQVSKHHWLLFALLGVFVVLFVVSATVMLVKGASASTVNDVPSANGRPPPIPGELILLWISIAMVLLLTG